MNLKLLYLNILQANGVLEEIVILQCLLAGIKVYLKVLLPQNQPVSLKVLII